LATQRAAARLAAGSFASLRRHHEGHRRPQRVTHGKPAEVAESRES
jgi:hypothetical protein